MSLRNAILSAAASIAPALALVGCNESWPSGTTYTSDLRMPAQTTFQDLRSSRNQPEMTQDKAQPAGSTIPGASDGIFPGPPATRPANN